MGYGLLFLQILKGLEAEGRSYEQFWELCEPPPDTRTCQKDIATQMAGILALAQ